MRSRSLLVAPILLLVLACFQTFHEIRVVDTHEGVAFESKAVSEGLAKGSFYEVLDLTVMQRDCERDDCTAWFVVRKGDAPTPTTPGNLASGRIVYGVDLANMETRTPARALTPGHYTISATVNEYGRDGEPSDSLLLDGRFSIERSESGSPRVIPDS